MDLISQTGHNHLDPAMSWLKNSQLRASFSRRRVTTTPPKDCDPTACYESFRKHWQQILDIINRVQPPDSCPSQDDVLEVVAHLDFMVMLLLLELRTAGSRDGPGNLPIGPLANVGGPIEQSLGTKAPACPSIEFLLTENLLDKLYTWSLSTGRCSNVLRLEQLKLYEVLVSNSRHQLLVHESFLRPLLKLLSSCANEVFPIEVEKGLVVLLNQLCVSLMHNDELLDLFFFTSHNQGPANFVIFSLLIPFVHREEGIGQQARDALLLCMSLSKKNDDVGQYIAQHSNVCPVLATGLGGLYSLLPRKLAIETEDWHRLTPDDVASLSELSMFMNSLEFCNAVVQVTHPLVRSQLLEFLYKGFLVPVMGPALLQSTIEELVAATAYLDLFIRSVTEPGLLVSFIRFILENKFDGECILDHLVMRLNSRTRLGLVTLALMDTLVSLHCEDLMLELVFRHLVPCTHVMLSQRRRVRDADPYCRSAERFLSLTPTCCIRPPALDVLASLPTATTQRTRPSPMSEQPPSLPVNLYGLKHGESLHGNYHAYLCDARAKIQACATDCAGWTYPYDGEAPPREPVDSKESSPGLGTEAHTDILSNLEPLDLLKYAGVNSAEGEGPKDEKASLRAGAAGNDLSLPSVGESSGYESFALKGSSDSTPENEPSDEGVASPTPSVSESKGKLEAPLRSAPEQTTVLKKPQPTDGAYMDIFKTTPSIGPFLDILLRKLEDMLSNGLYVNLHLTGLISRLAVHPQPLLRSFLLNQSLVFQPSIRSLFQVLGTLKQKIDTALANEPRLDELLAEAHAFIIEREDRLTNARRLALEASAGGAQLQMRNSTSADSFTRGENKRRSFSSALTSVFRRGSAPQTFRITKEPRLEATNQAGVYRYFNKKEKTTWNESRNESSEEHVRRSVMCAVIMDEWLKELAAITQEHAVFPLISQPVVKLSF